MKKTAAYWKEKLGLTTHVEGGAFKEIYRSDMMLPNSVIGDEFAGDRNVSTSIYFLLEYGEFSVFHKIASDEIWHHYDGGCLHIYEINSAGELIAHLLGKDIDAGQQPQVVIPAGSWFGSRVEEKDSYTLCGCTVAPGFDFADFELADNSSLSADYPGYTSIINELTKTEG